MADAMNEKQPPPMVKMPAKFLFIKGLGGQRTTADAIALFESHAEKLQQCVQSAAEVGSVVPSADQLKELIKKVREQATKEACNKFEQLVSQALLMHTTIGPIVQGVMHLPTQIDLIKKYVKTCSGRSAQTICECVYQEAKGASGRIAAGAAAAAALKSCHVTIDLDLAFSPPKMGAGVAVAVAVTKAPEKNQKCSTTSFVTNYLTGRVRNITTAVSEATGKNPNVEGKDNGANGAVDEQPAAGAAGTDETKKKDTQPAAAASAASTMENTKHQGEQLERVSESERENSSNSSEEGSAPGSSSGTTRLEKGKSKQKPKKTKKTKKKQTPQKKAVAPTQKAPTMGAQKRKAGSKEGPTNCELPATAAAGISGAAQDPAGGYVTHQITDQGLLKSGYAYHSINCTLCGSDNMSMPVYRILSTTTDADKHKEKRAAYNSGDKIMCNSCYAKRNAKRPRKRK